MVGFEATWLCSVRFFWYRGGSHHGGVPTIEKFMGDEGMKNRAQALSSKFLQGFPTSSVTALNAFRDFINHKAA